MKLDVGDYACRFKNGYCPNIRLERKSIGDLFGTLSGDYERFKKEIERAKNFDVRLLILIEGTLTDVLQGYTYSQRNGDSLVKQLFTLWEQHQVMPVFCSSREEMSRYIIELFTAIGRKALRDAKEARKQAKLAGENPQNTG